MLLKKFTARQSKDAADSLAMLLRRFGNQVDVANNGEEAIRLAVASCTNVVRVAR